MVFSTDCDLSYVYQQYKSEKVRGLFGLGWKNQEHTVKCKVTMKKREQQLKNLLCCLFPSKNGVEVHHYKKRKTAESFSYSKSVRKIHRSHAQHSKMFCIMDINMASAWV